MGCPRSSKTVPESVFEFCACTTKAAKRKTLAQQHQAQVKSILTKEQQEKMQQLRKERPARNSK